MIVLYFYIAVLVFLPIFIQLQECFWGRPPQMFTFFSEWRGSSS